jgi:hypothetical protein
MKRIEEFIKEEANLKDFKERETERKREIERDNKEFNESLATLRYYPREELSHMDKKFLLKLDTQLSHRNPDIDMSVDIDSFGKYMMNFSNGKYRVNKQCSDKERCFNELKMFLETLREIPISQNSFK